MSVPESKRGALAPPLVASLKARELAAYTLKITGNEKVFPPTQRALTDRITKTAISIHLIAWAANGIRVDKSRSGWEERAKERYRLQALAVRECNEMLALIDLARPVYHLEGKRCRYWAALAVDARTLLHAWAVSDKERYK